MLHAQPKDPITWVELSRVYAILGHREQAKRSMIIGLQLANNNRFVLRSASRLWVHLDDPEQAHHILTKAERTPHDPWLLAAEIAVGSIDGRKPKFVKIARKMLTDERFSRGHISELAAAVATLELKFGSANRSKKLFRLSLEDPTENSIAQAAWASRKYNFIHFNDRYLKRSNAFEAESWGHYQRSQWSEAVEKCKLWHFDQPFSSRPNIQGSCVTAVALEDYETSKWFADRGLMANPADFILLNNLAFAYINLKKFQTAESILSKLNRLALYDSHRVIQRSTEGLLKFRTGNISRGRELYSDARSLARKIQDDRLFDLASAFYAIEEVSRNSSNSATISSEVCKKLKRQKDPIFRVLEHKLTTMTSK